MKKLALLTILSLLILPLYAQQGTIKESLKVKSKLMGKEIKYSIYLPADYDKTNRRYPVLYLLHGYSDDETGWTQFGQAQEIADKTINNGDAPPMIIVMPDAEVTWYMNTFDNKGRYEDFFTEEFIPYIDANYRTRAKKEFRAVAGLSMGGFGTLLYAAKHPELFAAASALSAAVRTDEEMMAMPEERWENRYATIYGPNLKGKARLTDFYYKNSILKLVETISSEKLKTVRYYIDCGDDDALVTGNMVLHTELMKKGIPHEFRVRDGAHTWTYWRTALPEVLKFTGQSFRR
ncbi:S-formylglutathione hydrolase FrmB [Dyadobacter koreensis]|uniref:S-formylglutathione hydrolase FrmB n=1 Tax=Dyadobacter koreensis TaxID=408657 RepID=A0A1H6ZMG0_9BACT|nr:alpha/beta hydrolase-fold protein [Dyadobacter koreensis]SEJ50770.1 S-formylglutathione hydrolase FrmB [Dyadobacter koreensis]